MAKNLSLDQKLEQVQSLRSLPKSAESMQILQKHLSAKNNILVAKTARAVAEIGYDELTPDLHSAFDRFLQNGEKTDKACIAKIAIVKALRQLNDNNSALFLRGIRYLQLEASYGSAVDTAVEIRCQCAYALVDMDDPDVLYELITLAFDAERAAQLAAVRALANSGKHEAELLLRMLATSRIGAPEITGECLHGLMQLAPNPSFDFVAAYLDSPSEQLRQAAALALAQTHSSKAFEALRTRWEASPAFERRLLILPFATLRLTEALDFLLAVVETENEKLACEAVSALKIYQHDDKLKTRLNDVIQKRAAPAVTASFRQAFRS